ncbi:MAG TPA: NAD(P)-dependent alcohol dehydrogenase [Anaerolineae bacterium]|nr:NAD(P)-dependent alcohol dehydrogenase [Anaerolineae bacterium]
MKAILWTKYGPPEVLQLREVEKPTPKDNEVLIRIYATTVTKGDCEQRSLKFHPMFSIPMRMYVGLIRPKRITILGQELAGEVEAVGKGVKRFGPGDQVFGTAGFSFGTYAEYKCLPEDGLVAAKPANMTYDEAAAVPLGGLEALYYLRKGNTRSGQEILINGAGGSIGTLAIQLAKYFGAEVTAVDSTAKLDMLRSIGADRVIDYTQEDFTRSGETYDAIFDVVGKSPFSRSIRSLKQNGCYLLANPGLSQMVRGPWTSRTGSKKVISGRANPTTGDLVYLRELIEAEKIKPVVDRSYPLEQIIEAHRYVEMGGKKGTVVITV